MHDAQSDIELSLKMLLPRESVFVVARRDMWITGLFDCEREYVANAVEKRVREFTAGRNCARQAMEALGYASQPLPKGDHGEPVLPTGLTLSITHSQDFCIAAAAQTDDILSLGIDIEASTSLSENVIRSVFSAEERNMLATMAQSEPQNNWALLGFCAKEAFYKAHYQRHKRFLNFHDISLTFTLNSNEIQVRCNNLQLRSEMKGLHVIARIAVHANYALAVVTLMQKKNGTARSNQD